MDCNYRSKILDHAELFPHPYNDDDPEEALSVDIQILLHRSCSDAFVSYLRILVLAYPTRYACYTPLRWLPRNLSKDIDSHLALFAVSTAIAQHRTSSDFSDLLWHLECFVDVRCNGVGLARLQCSAL